jgi:hypothetical protein
MPNPTPARLLDREFLAIRCRLIDLAAALDRIDRAADPIADDPRPAQIRRSLDILATDAPQRAERIQLAFSLPYEEEGIRD